MSARTAARPAPQKKTGRSRERNVVPEEPKYPRVCLVRGKAKRALGPFEWERLEARECLYLIRTEDGRCLVCPWPTPASYLAVWVPEDCLKPYRVKRTAEKPEENTE